MYLKRPIWSDGASATRENPSESEKGEDSDAAAMVVEELVTSLNTQRLYRELTLSLRTGLRDACAEFSFLRIRGLRSLLKTLRTIADSDSIIRLFSHTQSIPDLQLVPVLFRHSLREAEDDRVTSLDHIFSVEPMKITSPSTDAEVAVALRVLEGCCLLHPQSTVLAHKHGAVRVMMNILSTRGVLEQGACLDALISILLDSSANQVDFGACNGIEEVAMLMRDKQADEDLRLRCGEFLLLLVGHVNGKDHSPIASVNEDIRRLLGEKSASLIWAASQFGSTGDPEQRITALHIQAGRVLESLDLQLAEAGAHVVMAVRNTRAAQELTQQWQNEWSGKGLPLNIEAMELDLLSLDSVVRFADAWNSRLGPLHVLINNAGIFAMGEAQKFSEEGYEQHMQVNHFAPAMLSVLLLPSLIRGSPSRIINVNSVMHSVGFVDPNDMNVVSGRRKYSSLVGYSSSKLAQIMFSSILFKKLPLETGVSVVCLSPGIVLTNVARDLPRFLQALYAVIPYFIFSPQEGCRSTLFSATDPQVPEYWETLKTDDWPACPFISQDCCPANPSEEAHNLETAYRVWEKTLELVGLPLDSVEKLVEGENIQCRYGDQNE